MQQSSNKLEKSQGNNNFKNILRKYFNRNDIWLLPNVLCYLRFLLMLAFLVLYLVPFSLAGNDKAHYLLAGAMIATSAFTDFLDGFIARKFQKTSDLGKLLDPCADKLSQFGIALALAITFYTYPSLFALLGFYFLKDFWMFFAVISLAKRNRTFGGARWYGKVSTFLMYVVLGSLLIAGPYIVDIYPAATQEGFYYSHLIIDSLASLALAANVFAFVLYFLAYLKLKHGAGKEEIESGDEYSKQEENTNAENL